MFSNFQMTLGIEGRTWSISEVEYVKPQCEQGLYSRDPPVVVTQHAKPPRKFVILSAQVTHCLLYIKKLYTIYALTGLSSTF